MLIEQGLLKRNDELAIDQKTFVVGQELDTEKTVINPRVQFATMSLPEDLQEKFLGKKMGELIEEEGGQFFEITELYSIEDPTIDKNFEEPTKETAENTSVDSQQAGSEANTEG